jgi:hypothetical protein
MGLLYPEKNGGDPTEDYHLSMFAAAYLTDASITKYGLRGYYYMVGDADSRTRLDAALLKRVFGEDVLEVAFGKAPSSLPTIDEMVKKLRESWHYFYLNVKASRYNRDFWAKILGADRVVDLPRTEDLAEVQAVISGLTEGVLDLQSAVDFLKKSGVSADDAKRIVAACAKIPIGLQKTFPNFDKIPMAGAKFASREDIWPIGTKGATPASKSKKDEKKDEKPAPKDAKKKDWKL